MSNPFPGVDPFLESQGLWPDFHTRFINYWCEAISDILPAEYEARIDERVQIVGLDAQGDRIMSPDVAVTRKDSSGETQSTQQPTIAIPETETVTLDLPVAGQIRESLIEILHRPERSLVTALELLSPTNKTGQGRGMYLLKRMELHTQPVHTVEVDLLLGGERLPMRKPLPPADFYAIVSRSQPNRKGQVYAWNLKNRLPVISIPLRAPDQDIKIDLAAVFKTAYERGKYSRSLNYKAGIGNLASPDTARWITERLASA